MSELRTIRALSEITGPLVILLTAKIDGECYRFVNHWRPVSRGADTFQPMPFMVTTSDRSVVELSGDALPVEIQLALLGRRVELTLEVVDIDLPDVLAAGPYSMKVEFAPDMPLEGRIISA
jgi:hypothetical protein